MKLFYLNFTCCLIVVLFPAYLFAISKSDDQKIKEAESYFQSEFQEEDYWHTDDLLLTATGSLKPIHLAPSVATVITSEDIEKIGATTLDEILETVPGLHTLPSGLNIFSSIWSIRGIHTKINPQVLLLINGIALSHPYDGGRPNTFQMPVSMISRVEVIRGPGSAIHGSDAFAGVINVITKDNFQLDGTDVGVRYGSFDSLDTWLMHGKQYMGWDFWASLETQKSEGDHNRIVMQDYLHSIGAAAKSKAPGYLDTSYNNVQSIIGLRKNDLALNFYGYWIHDNAMGPSALQVIDYNNKVNSSTLMADLQYNPQHAIPNWDIIVCLYGIYMKGDNYFQLLPASFLNMIGNPIVVSKYGGLEITGIYDRLKQQTLRLSAGVKYIDTNTESYSNFQPSVRTPYQELEYTSPDSPYIFMKPQTRNIWFMSLQDEWFLSRYWTFTGGFRLDRYSDFGTTINPRAALVWETKPNLTSKLIYGRAFRAPAFAEQYVQNNPLITGNPNLKPETINTYELAFEYLPSIDIKTNLNIFYYQAEDLIEYVDSLPALAQNYGEQNGHGLEFEIGWQPLENLELNSNFSWQRSVNKKTDTPVPDAPEFQFYLNPHWTFFSDWSLDGQFYWIGTRHRQDNDPRDEIDNYTLVNLTLRKKNIFKYFQIALSVKNLFDKDIREPSPYDPSAPRGAHIPEDYPMEGRAIWAELSFSPN